MELPAIFSKFSKEKEVPEPLLALEISANFIKTAIWQVKDDKIQLIGFGSVEKWESQDLDELVVLCDSSIAKAVELQEEEPNKVLFGLPETWVDTDKIVRPRLVDLRELSAKLDLKPLGFVVTTEAVVSYLKILESVPPNAILVRLLAAEVVVSLVKAGKLLGTQVVGRSEDLGADVYEGLVRFPQKDNLPPRLLVFNADSSLEQEEQNLVSYDWGELFLHFPRVEVLDEEFSIKAVAIAGGWEVAKARGLITASQLTPQEFGPKVQKVEDPETEAKPENLGFVLEQDIRSVSAPKPSVPESVSPPPVTPTPVASMPPAASPVPPVRKFQPRPSFDRVKFLFSSLWQLSQRLLQIPRRILDHLTFRHRLPFTIGLFGLFLLISVGAAFAFYWYAPSADITLYVKPKSYSGSVQLTVDPNLQAVDQEKLVLPGQKIEATVSQNQETAVSGEKVVGDKASGEVTIYNKSAKSKTFPQGTVLIGSNNLKFLTQAEATVASASAEEKDGSKIITYGKQKVGAGGSDIGPDYNLGSNTEFTFKDYAADAYTAKNENAFTGGTSRKIKVVTQADQDKLLKDLSEVLKKNAASDLQKKIPPEMQFFEPGIILEITEKKFDKNVGDEAEKINLSLAVKATTLTFSRKDLKEILLAQIKSSLPGGYQLQESAAEIGIKESEVLKDDRLKFKGTVEAKLIPQYDLTKIKEEIRGKYPYNTQSYFESLTSFQQVDIQIYPAFIPAKLKTFPRSPEKINIKIQIMD